MRERSGALRWWLIVAPLFLLPALHPALIPAIGVPSHLLWWVHVLPVALFTFRFGRRAAVSSLLCSGVLVAGGEAWFGAGYFVPADAGTVVALTVALTATNVLVAAFALYARGVSGRYRLLFESVGIGVIRLGPDGVVLGANPAAVALAGASTSAELTGRGLDRVLSAKGLPSIDHLALRQGWTGEITFDVGTPRTLHAVLAVAPDPDGRGSQILIADRSTEVMHEQEIERQAKLAALGEALAGVAHELNNPLTAILAHAQLGAMDEDPAEAGEIFEVIEHEAARMRDIVAELLGYSRRSETEECENLDQLLERMVGVQRIVLGKRIDLRYGPGWAGPVRASGQKIEQIILNLVSNAAYAVRSGKGRRIVVSAVPGDGFVDVEVRDDGPGITPEILDRLFEPFSTTKPEGEGTGLGLAISRRLARGWGGDLTARNVEPHGAAFTLRIPAAGADSLEVPAQRIA